MIHKKAVKKSSKKIINRSTKHADKKAVKKSSKKIINRSTKHAAKEIEKQTHFLEKVVKDILDEVGDCLYDDPVFRKKILTRVLSHTKVKKKLAFRFLTLMLQ